MTQEVYAGSGTDAFTPTRLITGEKNVVTADVTVESGAGVVARYSVLGLKTSGGKAILSASAAGDGSEVPKYILAYEVDATSNDVVAQAYAEGCFNPDILVYGTGHTATTVADDLRARNIYLKAPA